ncbi:ABC transporter ATP-binding protein [Chryseotalea sanaruensis]|uniref:ABC transporter ATP-binding protein n=1 Tax=Chryseotalea sanaruensis TaxID=2482724 RepID=A0A401U562_9BACT|nr:ATP-binding cassette domain-containing protein [Chryseotalea sanaruensis]GCC50022.1 ABC transporter ATP-binding protein [Chryseotalea sanaruensis]
MEKQIVIDVSHIYKSFGNNHVLKDFTMQVKRGENIAVLGKSGSGKSVLIKCIIRLNEPDKGNIKLLNTDVLTLDHEGLDELRSRVGFLFQSNALYDSMTVRENLEFPLRRHRIKDEMTHEFVEGRVMEALSNVGLAHTIDMMPAELSGGMRKRIALARTLILKPDIILYDEPTTGLDPITSREISELINSIQQKYQTTSIIISHDMSCIKTTADRIIMLIDGRCYAEDSFEELQNSMDEKIRLFFD